MLLFVKPDRQEHITAQLIGPPSEYTVTAAHAGETGTRPPTWWHGDAYASRTSLAAAAMMKRG